MTDLLLEHPQIAPLLQQAMQGDNNAIGSPLIHQWLHGFFNRGIQRISEFGPPVEQEPSSQAINLIGVFNITTAYFLSQGAYETLASGKLTDPANIARQKLLLHKVIRAMLIS